MSGNGNQVPLAPSQRGPPTYPRASTPHRAGSECYHPTGASGAYMAGAGAQGGAQGLRGQPAPQPSAPPAPQQDLSKTTMAGHTYVTQQNATPQSRPQYGNFQQFRGSQHGSRPNQHPRQQQQYIPSASSATGPVMYHPLVFPTHMPLPQSYQQPRSNNPGYFPYMTPYLGYTTPASHTPSCLRQPPAKRTSHRLAIINPVTNQDILQELHCSDNQYLGGDASERQTPQPESSTHSIAEFTRMVHKVANQPTACDSAIKSNFVSSKTVESPITCAANVLPQTNAVTSINNNIVKSDILNINNDNKPLGPGEVVRTKETPVVSAISDSPVIVPKTTVPMNTRTLKTTELLADASKSMPTGNTKQSKSKSKHAAVHEDVEKGESASMPHGASLQAPAAAAATQAMPNFVTSTMPTFAPSAMPTFTASAMPTFAASAMPPFAASATPTFATSAMPTFATSAMPTFSTSAMPTFAASVMPTFMTAAAPQPQRVREPRESHRHRSEEKEKPHVTQDKDKDTKLNGPTPINMISSVDSSIESINHPTSQSSEPSTDSTKLQVATKLVETNKPVDEAKLVAVSSEATFPEAIPTPTELLSASIEKVAREQQSSPEATTSASQAQAKLTQSIASCARNHPEANMKDIHLNNKTTDPETANGNSTNVTKPEPVKEDLHRNEKAIKNSKNSSKKANKMAANNSEVAAKETVSFENGKDETDKVSNVEQEKLLPEKEENLEKPELVEPEPLAEPETESEPAEASEHMQPPTISPFVPKYKYTEDQWSPLNTSGKKCYDIGLLMQIKDDPMSRNKPDVPLLETCNVIRTTPMQEPATFNLAMRPPNNALEPYFLKNAGVSTRSNTPKKDGRNLTSNAKGSVKLSPSASSSAGHKTVYVSLSLREEVKLNQTKDAWKPTRFKKENPTDEEMITQELNKKFRGILNKLTPQKFDTLLDKVKTLEINTEARLKGVIDLVFEKAIDEPNFSEAYAAMCSKLSMLKVPSDNSPDQCVNFRALIISRCQTQFVTDKVDEQVLKLEKDIAECTDQARKKELQLQLEEENRRVRMRSVGNVRFIGELYKLKMLTSKIMVYCMTYLIEKLEEEKLECLCKLLTTIGEQVESEVKDQLESVFKKMQEIVDKKSNKISSRVRFMLKDVIELRQRRWVVKSVVVDSQPKMMDQIQKEAEQHQRHIELMNSSPMGGGGFRRDDGGRGKRGDGRRGQPGNIFVDPSNWKTQRTTYTVDTTKLKSAATQKQNLNTIKLAPHNSGWNHGSGTKNTAQAANNSMISITKNMYSVLENLQTDPTSLRTNKDLAPTYHHSKSIERSTFNSRPDFNTSSGGGGRSGSTAAPRSSSGSRAAPEPAPAPPAPAAPPAPPAQEPLSDAQKKQVKSTIDLFLIVHDLDDIVVEIKQLFPPQFHTALVAEILNVVLEKAAKEVYNIAKTMLHLVSTGVISPENYASGLCEILEFAPDLYIDIPMLYEYLGKFLAPHIEKKHITFVQTLKLCEHVIAANHGHLILKAILKDLKESMGPSFVKTKWQESGLQLKQWMNEDQVEKWLEENKMQFLEGGDAGDEAKRILTPAETQSKLMQLMDSDESCDCIRGWVQDNLGVSSREDWFMRALIQAVFEHSLSNVESRETPHFSQERMNKYSGLIHEFGESRQAREASCLLGIQQLIHKLEHPQGLTLEIFQYLHEQYIISVEGFIAWEVSEKEPEGKAVMLKALTSFFTNIKEADNEDSCSED